MIPLMRLGLLLLAAFFILLLYLGLKRLSVEWGVSPLRYIVQDLSLALAGALGLAASWGLSRRLQAWLDALFRDPPLFTGDRFEARARPYGQWLVFAVLALGSLACLRWLLVEPGFKPAMVTAIVLGTTALMFSLLRSLYRRGQPAGLQMDLRGLTHPWYGHIPWADVHGMNFQETEIRGHWVFTMVLGVAAPDLFLDRMPWAIRLLHGRWFRTGQPMGALHIPLNPLGKPPREIYAAAWALRHRVKPDLLSHWRAPPVY